MDIYTGTWFCCQLLSRTPTREKTLQTPCMQLKRQQSKLRPVSLEKRQPEQVDRGQHMTELNKSKSVPEKMVKNWLYAESSSLKTKGHNMKCARTRLRKNKRQQFCPLQDFLEKNIGDGKSLHRLTGYLYQKLEETSILGLSNSKNHTSGLWNGRNWECTWRKCISFLNFILPCVPSCNHLDREPSEPLDNRSRTDALILLNFLSFTDNPH